MEMVNWLGIKAFKKEGKKQETTSLFSSTCEHLCRAHTSCQSDLDLSSVWGVCDTAPQWHLQPTAAILASLQCAISARCVVLLHEHWCIFRHRCCTWLCLPALVTPPSAPHASFQGSVLPRDQLSHDYVRDQRDRLSLISLTSVPTARHAATWIIEDIHMQICVIITPNNALCHPLESTESRVDSCFNPF